MFLIPLPDLRRYTVPKIVIIGAGSGFGSRLSIDILSREVLQDSTIALCDIDEERLAAVSDYVRRAIEGHSLPARCIGSTDRRDLLPGADVVVTAVSIAPVPKVISRDKPD